MPKRTLSYEDDLLERLRDPEYALVYLKALLEDDEDDADATFLLGLRHVARAHQIAHVAESTGLNRESLYKMLSGSGNPGLHNLRSVLKALGFRISLGLLSPNNILANSNTHTETRHVALIHLGDEGTCPIADTFRDVVAGQSFTVALGARTFEPTTEALNKAEIENNQDLAPDSANILLEIFA